MRLRLLAGAAVVAAAIVVVPAGPVAAHPLGNFTVNTYIGVRVEPERTILDLVVDMAEIPAVQTRRGVDRDGDGDADDAEGAAYATQACPDAARRIDVTVDGRRAPVTVASAGVAFPPGNAGLPTLRLMCALLVETGTLGGEREIALTSTAFTDRVGWREITAVGDRTTLVASNVERVSRSARLTAYPEDLLSSPPDQRQATVRARPGGAAPRPRRRHPFLHRPRRPP